MRIVKPTFRARDGTKRASPHYHVYFKDHAGVNRRLMACTDRAASNAWAHKLARLVSLRQADAQLDPDIARWVDGLSDDTRAKLCEWRVLDSRTIKTTLSLGEHVRDWFRHLADRGNTAKHVAHQRMRVLTPLGLVADAVFARCGRSIEPLCDDELKLAEAKLDALRHQCASFLVNSGVNVKAVQKRMRHSTSQLTLDVYAKLIGEGDEALAALPKLVG